MGGNAILSGTQDCLGGGEVLVVVWADLFAVGPPSPHLTVLGCPDLIRYLVRSPPSLSVGREVRVDRDRRTLKRNRQLAENVEGNEEQYRTRSSP